jgi:hypothetical protein
LLPDPFIRLFLGNEENRLYEALIAKITLCMFTYNIVSYINRIQHEPQTLGELFRELECELEILAISMCIHRPHSDAQSESYRTASRF